MNTVTINWKTISSSGNITIRNWNIIIGWDQITIDEKIINIVVKWDWTEISADSCETITVEWNSGDVHTISWDIRITGNVTWSINTMSGDVKCWSIWGSVKTMSGDISNEK